MNTTDLMNEVVNLMYQLNKLEKANFKKNNLEKNNYTCVKYSIDGIATDTKELSHLVQSVVGSSYLLRLNRELLSHTILHQRERILYNVIMDNLILMTQLLNEHMKKEKKRRY